MGGFYVTLTVRTENQQAVAATLSGRRATVSPPEKGVVVVWDDDANSQDDRIIQALGRHLSASLKSPVWAALVHDDDILQYWLFGEGELSDQYNSNPTYFTSGPSPPLGGDAVKLCEAFQSGAEDQVEQILRWSFREDSDDDRYVLESERHQALVEALGLPSFAIGFDFLEALERSDHPEENGFVRVGV